MIYQLLESDQRCPKFLQIKFLLADYKMEIPQPERADNRFSIMRFASDIKLVKLGIYVVECSHISQVGA